MEKALELLNTILEMDREGISRFIMQSAFINIDVAKTPVEMEFAGLDDIANLRVLGLVNGLLESMEPSNKRVDVVMRTSLLIDKFVIVDKPC